jgi:aryl-alcohol dehydrogenase-like predicted oxidoreductase
MKRRQFIQRSAAMAAATWLAGYAELEADMSSTNAPRLPRRPYGNTGIELSILGFGGMLIRDVQQDHADRLVGEAIERGVNYFEVAPTYGHAEQVLGPALRPYRKDAFIACKTTERTKEGSARELATSLERLQTDHVDLYQLHAITEVAKDVDAVFAKGGAMETFIAAKQDGRVRHLGFSAHSVDAALAAMDRYDFDSILFPVNFVTYYEGNFGPRVMERAKQKGVARLAIKAMAKQVWAEGDPQRGNYRNCWYEPLTDPAEALLGLKFAFSQDITAALPPGDERLWRLAMDLAPRIDALTDEEAEQLRAKAKSLEPIFTA